MTPTRRASTWSGGGASYNPSGIALSGLATVVDSLHAIRRAVYEEGWLTFDTLREALAADWAGYEPLRARLRALPKYGQGHPQVDALAAELTREIGEFVATIPNEGRRCSRTSGTRVRWVRPTLLFDGTVRSGGTPTDRETRLTGWRVGRPGG